ncbi:MAG: terminase small subunit, partial [Ruthenibacterium sp.]
YSQGSELLRKPEMLARVRALQHEQAARLSVSADLVITKLMDTLERCMAAQPVMIWDSEQGRKVESGEYQFDSKGALRALELLGKHLGMYQENVNVSAKVDTGKLDCILAQLKGGETLA